MRSADYSAKRLLAEKLLLLLLVAYLMVDTANGFLVLKLNAPNGLSSIYKQGLMLFCLLFNAIYEPRRFIVCLFLIGAAIIWGGLRFVFVDGVLFLHAFQESIKAIFFFLLVLTYSTFNAMTSSFVFKAMLFSTSVLLFNVLATYAGVGEFTYSNFGAKGFFFAGNAVSGVIVLCATFFLCYSHDRSLFLYLFGGACFAVLALLIGTKAGFMGVIMASILILIFRLNAKTLLIGLLVLSLVIIGVVVFWELLSENMLYQRVKHFYHTGGIERALFSGRDGKMETIMPLFFTQPLSNILLGLDMHALIQSGVTRVEFDWIDMIINFGLLFTLLIYLAHLGVFLYLLTLLKTPLVLAAIAAWLILMLVSSLAGHVIYNGMVTPLWALLTAAAMVEARRSVTSIA